VPGVVLRHAVRPDLLAEAETAGGLTAGIVARTEAALRALAERAAAVLLTCSTLGPVVETVDFPVPVLRADAALARQAVAGGGRVAVLYAAPTTREPTRLLFEAAARGTGAVIVVSPVAGAWEAFRAGETETYLDLIARAAEQAVQEGADRVALAQASMAGAAGLVRGAQPPLTSPSAGLRAALLAMRG
jgi:aspartate/glutamate racemase